MDDSKVCHNQILPFHGTDCVKLILFQRNVYKFTIKSNDPLKKILQDYGEIQVQHELENLLVTKERSTKAYSIILSMLRNLLQNELYSEPEHQFLLTFLDNNQKVTESSHIVENIHKERIHNSDNSSDILIVDSEITEIKERLPTNGDFENAAKKLKVCKMEEERLKKLSDIPILEIPKVQNPKEHTKKEKGILFRIFRYIFG
ncbi:hypothetical protein HNY73_019118 [Argiope bruennichi]|uniref:Uncharacterized protein n=1 Tax=Argiope bruennichi TaxID=94029 RepID=A0A8T0EGG7_ARGBR|nr:hypothetical protein HNY73_019118 [Argiope bruennichi]